MAARNKGLVKTDGRTTRYGGKNTTERESIQMGDHVVTVFRYTKTSGTSSPYWQARCYLDGKVRQISTKEEDLQKAKGVAKKWYATMLARLDDGISTDRIHKHPHLFDEVAQELLKEWKTYSESGIRHKDYWKDHNWRYAAYIQPFFKQLHVEQITTPKLVKWQEWRQRKRLKSPILHVGELKKEYTVIYQILKYAQERGYIENLPTKPRTVLRQIASSKNAPTRATFTFDEYKHLLSVSRRRIQEAKQLVDHPPTKGGGWPRILISRRYLHYFIIFLAHTGVRPGEANRIKHHNVKMIHNDNDAKCYLTVWIQGKKTNREVYGKYGAYFAYKGLCENICPNHKSDDLVFPILPRGGLRDLIIDADLRYNQNGDRRDSKSFRHFYIMSALQDGVDEVALRVQCDVSPAIMRDHYARHAQPFLFKEQLLKVVDIQSP